MSHITHRILVPVVASMLCACGGGGDGGGGAAPTPPVRQGSQAIADVDTDDDGLIEISTLEQLDWMRNDLAGTSLKDQAGRVNSGGCRTGGCNGYELAADLNFDTNGDGLMDARDTYFDPERNGSNAGWLPIIGMHCNLEGNGHRILNLFINRPNQDNVGLLEGADAAVGASIALRNIEFSGPLTSITGRNNVGALVGWAIVSGTMQVESNTVAGKVTGRGFNAGGLVGQFSITGGQLTVRNNQSSATLQGVAQGTGGLIGRVIDQSSTPIPVMISNNSTTGPVSSTETSGGLLGVAHGDITIESCSASGDVTGVEAGGLVGRVFGSRFILRNSQSTGNVARSAESVSNIIIAIGGLIGSLSASQVTISDVRVTADAVSGDDAGGLIGTARLSVGSIDIRNAFADVSVIGGDPSRQNVGGLIGFLWVDAQGQFRLSDSFANGTASGRYSIGGVIGSMRAESTAQITIGNVFALGQVNAAGMAGGLFGTATVLNTARITVQNSYAAVAVNASELPSFSGGLAGNPGVDPMSDASITFENSYWATDTSGQNNPYGSTSARLFSNAVVGAPLDQLSCPASASDVSCWTSELYHLWDSALNTAGQPLWRFSGPGKLPALTFGNVVYQPVTAPSGELVVSRE